MIGDGFDFLTELIAIGVEALAQQAHVQSGAAIVDRDFRLDEAVDFEGLQQQA